MKKDPIYLFFLLAFFFLIVLITLVLFYTNYRSSPKPKAASSDISLESYCRDGYYHIPGEQVCSRAPLCGGKSYDEVKNLPQPNPQECMGDGQEGRDKKGCAGYVPVCCYEMVRTGNHLMCIGYWERLWCHPDQCAVLPEDIRSSSQCGHAYTSWCGCPNCRPPVALSTRLGLPLTPTNPPQPTATLIPSNNPPQPTNTPQLSQQPPSPTQYLPLTNFPSPTDSVILPFFPTSQPNTPPSITPYELLPTNSPLFKLPQLPKIEIKIEKEKIEQESAKTLDIFEYVFSAIKKADNQLETNINNFLYKTFNFQH